jgi:chromosome segregation protein
MPARLKSFELHGYKTFASRNEFIFSDGITAIVGPNGSGKSNIADALRWVLGEQSFGLLRAKKTEDMIFAGSENRPRAGMASATVVFDNTDGWLPIDFSEVGITRRAYRDGENEYLLNGQRVRLKDVSEVLAQSGLAERTYTIIGQGLVDAALALKAEERRRLFEEAAGIGLHRTRREEAIKRLETTRRNLERVQDILAELQPRLRSLERQAKRAQEYDQMRADLKVILREWYGYHWHLAQSELVVAQVSAKKIEEVYNEVQSNQVHLDEKLSTYRSQINSIREELSKYHQDLTLLHQKREALSREQAVNNERARLLTQQLEQLFTERNKASEEIILQKDQLEVSDHELLQLEQELEEAQQSAAESLEALGNRQNDRTALESLVKELQAKITELEAKYAQIQARRAEKETHIRRLQSGLEKINDQMEKAQVELTDAEKQYHTTQRTKAEKESITLKKRQELNQVQEKLSVIEQEIKKLDEKISTQKTLAAQVQAEMEVLEEAQKNLTGYEEGARILLQAVNDKRLNGAIGSLGNSLVISEQYETAIAAVLGEYIDALVIETIDQSESALDLIDSDTIRGSIFPLDVISPVKPLSLDPEKAPVNPDAIHGVAANLIKSEPRLKPIIDLLFGQVIVVEDRKTAREIIASREIRKLPGAKVVTLKGEIYYSSGPIVRGATKKGLLARPRRQRETKTTIEQVQSLLEQHQEKRVALQNSLEEARGEEERITGELQKYEKDEQLVTSQLHQQELQVEKIQRNVQWQQEQKGRTQTDIDQELFEIENHQNELEQISSELKILKVQRDERVDEINTLPLEELITQNTYWNTNMAVIQRAVLDAKKRKEDKQEIYQQIENNLNELGSRSSQLENEIEALNKRIDENTKEEGLTATKIEELSAKVNPLEEELNTVERDHSGLLLTDAESRLALRTAEQQYTQAKINLARHQEAFESLRGHIEDDFGLVSFDYTDSVSGPKPLPLDGMVEELPKVAELPPELEETIRQKKAQIRRMGAINAEAQSEFREVKERFEFLTSQVEDLVKAESHIKEVIEELDILMEREFHRTFEAVAQEFKQIFTRLFGGGSARLALTDPDNLTETGIDIEARLPGRREQGLSLLSGGERSLTAAALVFSLLRVSPTPFCILDEVDAMLDEANVGRFRDLLTELSEKTQFIVITHNRNTVQAANIIYGVTMGRDSASQVISLRMDELGEEFGV